MRGIFSVIVRASMFRALIVAVAAAGLALSSMLALSAGAQNAPAAAERNWTIPGDDQIRRLLVERFEGRSVGVVVGVLEPTGTRIVPYGTSGASDGRALDGETVFQIGSVTKVFTGLLLADLTVRGLVQLEDPAGKYLPVDVRMPQRGRAITLIDLSKHWSALPSMPTNFSLRGQPDPYAAYTEQDLYRFLNEHVLTREPGTQEYSNLGVALLGRLLARRSGLDYEVLLRQRVIDPLGLRHTAVTVDAEMRQRLTPGHDRFMQPVETWNLLAMPASGSLRSTANDLLRFVRFNLSDESPLREAMLLQRAPGRALGWGRSTLGGDAVYGHEGGKEGYRSAVVFNPRTKTGVVVLMNTRSDESPMAVARHLLFGGQPLAPLSAIPRRPVRATLDSATLSEYEGRYRLDSGGIVEVARRGDHLLVQVAGEGVATYFGSARDLFWGNTDDADLRFDRDAASRVSTLTLRSGSVRRVSERMR